MTSVTVDERQMAIFTCVSVQDDVMVTWMKNGKKLKETDRIEMTTDRRLHKLIIKHTTADDTGEYSCTVGDISTKANLKVNGTLTFLISIFILVKFMNIMSVKVGIFTF